MNDDHDRDPEPTLNGLSLSQLEAVRGYIETVQALPALAACHADYQRAVAEEWGLNQRGDIGRRHRAVRDAVLLGSGAAGPHGDGVRFAVAARREEWERVKADPKRPVEGGA